MSTCKVCGSPTTKQQDTFCGKCYPAYLMGCDGMQEMRERIAALESQLAEAEQRAERAEAVSSQRRSEWEAVYVDLQSEREAHAATRARLAACENILELERGVNARLREALGVARDNIHVLNATIGCEDVWGIGQCYHCVICGGQGGGVENIAHRGHCFLADPLAQPQVSSNPGQLAQPQPSRDSGDLARYKAALGRATDTVQYIKSHCAPDGWNHDRPEEHYHALMVDIPDACDKFLAGTLAHRQVSSDPVQLPEAARAVVEAARELVAGWTMTLRACNAQGDALIDALAAYDAAAKEK
jgi:uncharacterized Zn finger protein (UPF0148 family)